MQVSRCVLQNFPRPLMPDPSRYTLQLGVNIAAPHASNASGCIVSLPFASPWYSRCPSPYCLSRFRPIPCHVQVSGWILCLSRCSVVQPDSHAYWNQLHCPNEAYKKTTAHSNIFFNCQQQSAATMLRIMTPAFLLPREGPGINQRRACYPLMPPHSHSHRCMAQQLITDLQQHFSNLAPLAALQYPHHRLRLLRDAARAITGVPNLAHSGGNLAHHLFRQHARPKYWHPCAPIACFVTL